MTGASQDTLWLWYHNVAEDRGDVIQNSFLSILSVIFFNHLHVIFTDKYLLETVTQYLGCFCVIRAGTTTTSCETPVFTVCRFLIYP